MTLTAVICAGWKERSANVDRIHADLLAGSVIPDRIIVLDNTEMTVSPWEHLATERSTSLIMGTNTECHGKFVAALFAPADYYLLADDDTSVGPRTVECLMRWAKPGFVTGYWGVRLADTDTPFSGGFMFFPSNLDQPMPVDAFHGRVMFMAHDALVRMFALEGKLRTGGDMTGDDILAGLANPEGSVMVPMTNPDQWFVDLSEAGVAMQYQEGYHSGRDEFTLRALAAR